MPFVYKLQPEKKPIVKKGERIGERKNKHTCKSTAAQQSMHKMVVCVFFCK